MSDTTSFVIGLDLGQAQDFTALTVIEKRLYEEKEPTYDVVELRRFALGTPYTEIVPLVATIANKLVDRKPTALIVDETGVGRPVVDMLRKEALKPNPVVITCGSGETFDSPSRTWRVAKTVLVSVLRVLLEQRRLQVARSLPAAAILVQEMLTFKVKTTVAGNETFEAWRERDHDDLVLAVALACWGGERFRPRPPQRWPTRIRI